MSRKYTETLGDTISDVSKSDGPTNEKENLRPLIDIKINNTNEGENKLTLTISGKGLELTPEPSESESKKVTLTFTSKETIYRPLFNVETNPDKAPTAEFGKPPTEEFTPSPPTPPRPPTPPPPTAIISMATGKPLHYDEETRIIIASVPLTVGAIRSRYHRVIVSGTGQEGFHTITANLNQIRVGVNSSNRLLVRSTGVSPQLNTIFQKEAVDGSVALVRFSIGEMGYLKATEDRVYIGSTDDNESLFFLVT